ncbi:MAG: glycosyltransferase family 4 protein [Patescibacteria group bacterium]
MKKSLKIGFFTDTYLPQVNGVVTSIESFRQELEKQGHQVYIFCPRADHKKDDKSIIRFPSIKFVFQPEYHVSLPFTRHLLRDFWEKELDIVHAHTPFSLGLLGYYYSYIKKVPFVYTYHTLYPEYVKSYVWNGRLITPKMVAKITAMFSNRCDLNIAPSGKIKKLLKSYGVKKPITVLPTGIKVEKFSKRARPNNFRSKYKIKPEEKVLLYVGRLGQEKNIEFLLKAFFVLKQSQQKIKLILVGDGPAKKNLQKLVKDHGLGKDVIFTSYLSQTEVIRANQSADLFIFASKTDTQGLVLLEAAASGLPIVAVKDDAFVKILEDKVNGYIVKQNVAEFNKRILQILDNKKLYQRLSKKSAEIAENFSIEKQTAELIQAYRKLLH